MEESDDIQEGHYNIGTSPQSMVGEEQPRYPTIEHRQLGEWWKKNFLPKNDIKDANVACARGSSCVKEAMRLMMEESGINPWKKNTTYLFPMVRVSWLPFQIGELTLIASGCFVQRRIQCKVSSKGVTCKYLVLISVRRFLMMPSSPRIDASLRLEQPWTRRCTKWMLSRVIDSQFGGRDLHGPTQGICTTGKRAFEVFIAEGIVLTTTIPQSMV